MKTGDIVLITAMMWPVAIFVGCIVVVVVKSNWHSAHHHAKQTEQDRWRKLLHEIKINPRDYSGIKPRKERK